MITIMKASAGSGKTFTLAKKYIGMLLGSANEREYRHILAVTFTNKATDEMKSRILHELHILSNTPEKSGYYADFVRLTGSEEKLKEKSHRILCNILHDYGAFSVSTIDKFFQQTLKAFSREIGQFASYQIELDKESVVNESVDRMLDNMTEDDSELLRWLTGNMLEQIETDGKYDLDNSLKRIAYRLRSQEYRDQAAKYGLDSGAVFSMDTVVRLRNECRKVFKEFAASVQEAALAVDGVLKRSGVSADETNRGFLAAIYRYTSLRRGERIERPSASFMEKSSDSEKWFSKSKEKKYLPLVYPALEAPLKRFCDMFGEPYRTYRTACVIDGQLYGLGVSGEFERTFNELLKEKNVMCLDDSNLILKGIIDGSDAPFIYEKSGVRYEHFLIDEFQDTASVQWENFLPLLRNSEAQGFDSLIVGDVKQSIYRWRGSEWNLLDTEVEKEFPDSRTETLRTNYRSLRNVVDFNNSFFPAAAEVLDILDGEHDGRKISEIYSDVVQAAASRDCPDGGRVTLEWCAKDDIGTRVFGAVNEAVEHGARYGDIAVLVRGYKDGENAAAGLIENGIPVLTDDTLLTGASVTVRRLVSLLSLADNPQNTAGGFIASSLGISLPESCTSLCDLSESLLDSLREHDPETFSAETLYIQSFADILQDYVAANGNSLNGFLKHWEENGTKRCINSPSSGNSVRIITIHKSKGLDFPYVIFPYAESVKLYRAGKKWCGLRETGEESGKFTGMFDVELSSGAESTFFDEAYRKETRLQHVDNLNILYVALTRASKGLYIISEMPSKKFVESLQNGDMPSFRDMSGILLRHIYGNFGDLGFTRQDREDGSFRYVKGEFPDFSLRKHPSEDAGQTGIMTEYRSWPIGDRLLLRTDGADFFDDGGASGVSASHRLRGIVLHDILAGVIVPPDLDAAVGLAERNGLLSEAEAASAKELLSARIASGRRRGWFPADASKVRNEVSLMDCDGTVHRPDRVIFTDDGGVTVVDYKFGAHRATYDRQVAVYADIFRRMGYGSVKTALWYVDTDEVRES